MSKNIQSSYRQNNFDSIFKIICENIKPKSVLEIGILDGYSLNSFVRTLLLKLKSSQLIYLMNMNIKIQTMSL